MSIRKFTALVAPVVLALAARAEVDLRNFDTSVKPSDDFYRYANGSWLKTAVIPPDKTSWGSFDEIDERNKANLHTILDRVAAKSTTPVEKMVGDFYASGMDETAINAAGITPLKAELERIAAIQDVAGVQAEIAHLHTIGVRAGFVFASEPNPKDSSLVIAGLGQGGLGLPERDYYFRDDEKSKKLREQYAAHVGRLLILGGEKAEAAAEGSAKVMGLETALAKGSKTRVDLRDPVANFHPMSVAELQQLTPHFNWSDYFKVIGLANPGTIDVGQPEFFKALDAQLAAASLGDWKAYLRWQFLHGTAPYLSEPLVQENFDFYGRTLTGQEKPRDRWKRVLQRVDGSVGEALGQLYVAQYFPPEAKTRMMILVGNLQDALRNRLQKLEWMDEPTRTKALAKLDAFTVKIGYPDKWRDYSALTIDRGPYVLNVLRSATFEFKREVAKVGKPVDKTEWEMSPPTVNAYYEPQNNEIVFPAGILQPPFFDFKADDAVNYGGIGAVIGHEMTHGFDDQGRQFDAKGNLEDWWTKDSQTHFLERSTVIVQQFSSYTVLDGLHINGALTQGENIADLGGIKIAYAALEKALEDKPRAPISGFTPEQRFFLSWATVWRDAIRDEYKRMLVRTDPHSPAELRVNGPFSNLPEFYKAFDIPAGSPMRRGEKDHVEIW